MNEFFKNLLGNVKSVYSKLSKTQKLVIFGVILLLVVSFIFLISFSSKPTETLLFQTVLSQNDLQRITNKLTEWNVEYKIKDGKYIVVKDENTSAYLRMKLGLAGVLPSGIKGWELFDTQSCRDIRGF